MQVLQTMSAMATSLAALESAERARAAEEVCLCVIDYNCTEDAYCCRTVVTTVSSVAVRCCIASKTDNFRVLHSQSQLSLGN